MLRYFVPLKVKDGFTQRPTVRKNIQQNGAAIFQLITCRIYPLTMLSSISGVQAFVSERHDDINSPNSHYLRVGMGDKNPDRIPRRLLI